MVLIAVRYVLPIAVVLGGLVIFLLQPDANTFHGAAAVIGAGLSIMLLNFLHRQGVDGDAERRVEEDARSYFDAHGHWPDESPEQSPQPRAS